MITRHKQSSIFNNEALLKEYEVTSIKTQNIENLLWKTFSMIGILSITLLISDNILNGSIGWRLYILIGSLSISLTLVWWKIARRWWDIQSLLYVRLKHIEEDLSMLSNRYISYRDGVMKHDAKLKFETDVHIKERMNEIKYEYTFANRGVQKYFSTILLIMPLSWVARIIIALPIYIKINNIANILFVRNILTLFLVIYFLSISVFSIKEYFELYAKTKNSIKLALLQSIAIDVADQNNKNESPILSKDEKRRISKLIKIQKYNDKKELSQNILEEKNRILGK